MMRKKLTQRVPIVLFFVLNLLPVQAQDNGSEAITPVQMTVAVTVRGKSERPPELKREDIVVQQGEDRLQVTGWTAIDRSPLDLFILIDESARPSIVSQFVDLREFINSLPKSTFVGSR
ncbi:MAG: hypothetical protein ABSB87_15465 [Terriglobales bacterium]|jgi:hypothetical protein